MHIQCPNVCPLSLSLSAYCTSSNDNAGTTACDNNDNNEDGDGGLPYEKLTTVPLQASLDSQTARALLGDAGSTQVSTIRAGYTEGDREGDRNVSELPRNGINQSATRRTSKTTEFQGQSALSDGDGGGIAGVGVGHDNASAVETTRRAEVKRERPRQAAPALESGSEHHHQTGGVSSAGAAGTLVKDEPELLYGINFSVAPPREGGEPVHLLAQAS